MDRDQSEAKSDTARPMASGGGSAESGIFVLKAPTQYDFTLRGGAKISAHTPFRTILENIDTGESFSPVGGDIGLGTGTTYSIQAATSLLLPAGRYRWQSAIQPTNVATLAGATLRGDWTDGAGRTFVVHGTRRAFSCTSGREGVQVFARGFVTCQSQPGERIRAIVLVSDQATNTSYPISEFEATQPVDSKDIGVVPYVLQKDHLYVTGLQVEYDGAAAISCRLEQSFSS